MIVCIVGAFYFFNPFRGVPSSSFGSFGRSTTPDIVSMSSYNSVGTGMTYEQVTSIIGSNGKESSRVDIKGAPLTVMYTWQNSDGSNMLVTFQDNAMVNKAQFGLK